MATYSLQVLYILEVLMGLKGSLLPRRFLVFVCDVESLTCISNQNTGFNSIHGKLINLTVMYLHRHY